MEDDEIVYAMSCLVCDDHDDNDDEDDDDYVDGDDGDGQKKRLFDVVGGGSPNESIRLL